MDIKDDLKKKKRKFFVRKNTLKNITLKKNTKVKVNLININHMNGLTVIN